SHAIECFPFENYPRLFEMFFPQISHIPHNSRFKAEPDSANVPEASQPEARLTRRLRRWAIELSDALKPRGTLSAVTRKKLSMRVLVGFLRQPHRQEEVILLHKLQLLEGRLRQSNASFDWSAICQAGIRRTLFPDPLTLYAVHLLRHANAHSHSR